MKFQLTIEFIEILKKNIESFNKSSILEQVEKLHPVEIAEIISHLTIEESQILYDFLKDSKASEVLIELDEDLREKLLKVLTPKEIAQKYIQYLPSDDVVDILNDFSEKKREEIIKNISDIDKATDIVDLLNYEERTAGSLMGKEVVWVNEKWSVKECIIKIRKQVLEFNQIYSIYVVDSNKRLLGILSIKKLLFISDSVRGNILDLYNKKIIAVKTYIPQEEVSSIMEKYNLVTLPVVDELNRLVGRITIDDVVDVIKEEAEKDYQMASGIINEVTQTDTIWKITRVRIPWLMIGLFGGILSAMVIGNFECQIKYIPTMAFFIPLITAMGGNIGVQSSAIVVQGLANKTFRTKSIFNQLVKEFFIATVNGVILSTIILLVGWLVFKDLKIGITVAISLFTVITVAALLGTFVPLMLDKKNIDPALATGPFITTLNDILGLFIYFIIGQIVFKTI